MLFRSSDDDLAQQVKTELDTEDSGTVLAPIWDSDFTGQEMYIDSVSNQERYRLRELAREAESEPFEEEPNFRENIGLAHTHINGQTLLFFAMGVVFLFTSAKPRVKKIVYWIFGISVVLHAIGLSGEGYHWYFDDILAISGAVILAVIVYMAIRVYVDLSRSGSLEPDKE